MPTVKLNVEHTKELLEAFEFQELFVTELGWNNPRTRIPLKFSAGPLSGEGQPIAELGGVVVLQIELEEFPDSAGRRKVHDAIRPKLAEHILIFVDKDRSRSCWSWVKVEDKKRRQRDHFYFKGQPGDGFISKISSLAVDLEELDKTGEYGLLEASKRVREALDVQRVVRRFYSSYKGMKDKFVLEILGFPNKKEQAWYASVILNRLMFIYFLQKGGFLDGGKRDYLEGKLKTRKGDFYSVFLQALFFDAFAKPNPKPETRALCGDIPYINGGLFIPHKLERKGYKIVIPDSAFEEVFELLGAYSWTFNDVPGGRDDEINPDILGYIFEKYINQKELGAFYTPTEITDYLCHQTVEQLILDKVKMASGRNFESAGDMLLRVDARQLEFLLRDVLPSISLLDPACGSGAFLFAALKSMLSIYSAAIGRISGFNDEVLNKWRKDEFKEHRSEHYWLKKKIIKDNLYGVDIVEEATEIAKLRLFMAVVSSTRPGEALEPLPNIDFNILAGNSLIGLMRVEDSWFETGVPGQERMLDLENPYLKLVRERNELVYRYKAQGQGEDFSKLKQDIETHDKEACETLNKHLLTQFNKQKVVFERARWDAKAGKPGKPVKRQLSLEDIDGLAPFHWGYSFNLRFTPNISGFDAIITNPPWQALKPQDKEFFGRHNPDIEKNNTSIKELEAYKNHVLRENPSVLDEYEAYLSDFPYQSAYFRSSPDYENQTAEVNGKKTGTDVNLYKLFTERCFSLLRPGGYCGIIAPTNLVKDLGAFGLRRMLYGGAVVTGIVGLSNERFLFEGVDHRFSYCILSYMRGVKETDVTTSLNVVFRINPREAVGRESLESFLDDGTNRLKVSIGLIKQLFPDSWILADFRDESELRIAEKFLQFPRLADEVPEAWGLRLTNEFHMTNDSGLFEQAGGPGRLPLFEGKMIQQFESGTAPPKYWVDEKEGRRAILGRSAEVGQELDYQHYRLAHRAVASNTNARTMIASILPKRVFYSHSLYANKGRLNPDDMGAVLALLNSAVVDYQLRRSVLGNLTLNFIYQLRMPRLSGTSAHAPSSYRAMRLICTTVEFADLWNEAMANGAIFEAAAEDAKAHPFDPKTSRTWTASCGATQTAHRARLRAELDGIVAHAFGLTEEEFRHILATFPLMTEQAKANAMTAFRDVKLGVVA